MAWSNDGSHFESAPENSNIIRLSRKGRVGTRIFFNRAGTFDNTTVKTFRLMIEVAAGEFDAVRPIFSNFSGSTYTVAACNARALANFTADPVLTTPTAVTLPSAGVVPAAFSGTRANHLVGNWLDLSSVARDDGGAGAIICFDAYVSSAASLTIVGNGTSDTLTSWATRSNRKYILRHNDTDCVTTPANFVSTTNRIQTIFAGVQYVSKGRVINVMTTGDSISEGRGTIIGEGWVIPACEAVQTQLGVTIECMQLGQSSASQASFKNYLDDIIAAGIYPDICIYPNASPNSYSTPIVDNDIKLAKQANAMISRTCATNNIHEIRWSMIPCNPSVHDYNSSDSKRVAFNDLTKTYTGVGFSSLPFSETLTGVTDSDGQVNILVGATTDNIHPNDSGNNLLASVLTNELIKIEV